MQFLKTLFWVALTAILVLWAKANWFNVELRLWGGLVADVKLPIALFTAFFLGLLPTLIVHWARIWSLKRRLEPAATIVSVPPATAPVATAPAAATPATSATIPEERVATDSKAWPAP
jgi:putative membrane protein